MKKSKLIKTLALALAISSASALTLNIKANAIEGYWKSINNSWYFMDNSGKIQTGWVQDNGYWYYLGSDGTMKTGWLQDGGKWYYLWSNGQLAVNTTIQGYTSDSNGVCTLANRGAFSWKDAEGTHAFRTDIAQRQDDINATNKLTTYNVDLSQNNDLRHLQSLVSNITRNVLTISEAKEQCVGKVVGNKYLITDIKYFSGVFKNTQGVACDDRINTLKSSSDIYNYKSSSNYTYDEGRVYSCYNERSNQWEAMRVVVEFEEI
ncbi:hypothetical protein [Clostridium beijerinckii]|uniref:hypothetical protein n=1 Tax=Clostridium beijerinckii TaxID=1520 RepID=UPI0038735FD3